MARTPLDIYDKPYYKGQSSNYVFRYGNLRFRIFWIGRLRILRKFIKSGKLLDVGCAFGFFINFLEKQFNIYGIDISAYAVRKAQKLTGKFKALKCCDILKGIPFEDKFNAITAFDVMEHLSDPAPVFHIFYGSLHEKGLLYIEQPTDRTLIDRDKEHNYRPLKEWTRMLDEAGFEIVYLRTYYTIGFRMIMIPNRWFVNYCSIIAKKKKK